MTVRGPEPFTMWRNVKTGHDYWVLTRGVHSETGEELVVYVDGLGQVWIRPLDLFRRRFRPQ